MNKMTIKERIAKLIDVKTMVTLSVTAVFCVLAAKGLISTTEFITIFTMIISFYFGTQAKKGE